MPALQFIRFLCLRVVCRDNFFVCLQEECPSQTLHPPSGGDVAAVGVLEAVGHGAHHPVLQLVDAVIVLWGGIGKEEGRLEWALSTFHNGS